MIMFLTRGKSWGEKKKKLPNINILILQVCGVFWRPDPSELLLGLITHANIRLLVETWKMFD